MANSNNEEAKWYVAHTYSGHENKVKVSIEKIVENSGMQDLVHKVVVPVEKITEIKNGKKKVKERKLFPGYVLVKMIMNNDTWYIVRNTQGVTSFVGPGSKPVPLTEQELKNMGIHEKQTTDVAFEVDESLKIVSGPFEDFVGKVKDVDYEKMTLHIVVSMFGRETPVELDFSQVEKL